MVSQENRTALNDCIVQLSGSIFQATTGIDQSERKLMNLAIDALLTIFRPKLKQLPKEVVLELKGKAPTEKLAFLIGVLTTSFCLHAPDEAIISLSHQMQDPIEQTAKVLWNIAYEN